MSDQPTAAVLTDTAERSGDQAGIAAFLLQAARLVRDGTDAAPVPRMETWWACEVPT